MPMDVSDKATFSAFEQSPNKKIVVFAKEGDEMCAQVLSSLDAVRKEYSRVEVGFLNINPSNATIAGRFKVTKTPTCVFFYGSESLGQLVGINPPLLMDCIKALNSSKNRLDALSELRHLLSRQGLGNSPSEQVAQQQQDCRSTNDRLKKLVNSAPVILFMKGTREAPSCRFSKEILSVFERQGIKTFATFDVLEDEEVRNGLKEFSNWPTYPQLYVNGELLGGVDIIKTMAEDGTLMKALPKCAFA